MNYRDDSSEDRLILFASFSTAFVIQLWLVLVMSRLRMNVDTWLTYVLGGLGG